MAKISYTLVARIAPQPVTRDLADAVQEVADGIADDARRNAPVLTGRLRDSIGVAEAGELTRIVGVEVPYAGFVNYGTTRQAANPFFTRAVEGWRGKWLDRIRKVIRNR